jgi:hypothetical protein
MRARRWAVIVAAAAVCAQGADGVAPAATPGSSDDGPFRYASTIDTPPPPGSAQRGRSGVVAAPAPPVAGLLRIVLGAGTTTTVTGSDELARALAAARPGDTIRMAPGTYDPVTITGSGTAEAPITLTGPPDAVITGSGKDYTLHLDGASHWQLVGFGVTGGGKGVMLDNSQHNLLDGLDVGRSGDEAVHLRAASSDNTVQRSSIHDTGLAQPQYGEGVYVGSAKSNWKKVSGGGPDLSMRNHVVGNTFQAITAENVDVKEETAGTLISGNRFDGSATSGENYADSIVDVKGYDTTVVDNVTTGESSALKNIIETHVITEPATSGCGNTIERNTTSGFEPKGAQVAVDRKCG